MTSTLDKYIRLLHDKEMTSASISSYTYDVSRFLRDNILEDIDEDNITPLFFEWVSGRQGTVSDSTLRRQTGAIRLYANHIYGVSINSPKQARQEVVKLVPRDALLPKLHSPDWNDDWRKTAACKTKTHIMFKNSDVGRAEAKAICATCPGRAPCLDFALRNKLDAGVWGGLDEKERKVRLTP